MANRTTISKRILEVSDDLLYIIGYVSHIDLKNKITNK